MAKDSSLVLPPCIQPLSFFVTIVSGTCNANTEIYLFLLSAFTSIFHQPACRLKGYCNPPFLRFTSFVFPLQGRESDWALWVTDKRIARSRTLSSVKPNQTSHSSFHNVQNNKNRRNRSGKWQKTKIGFSIASKDRRISTGHNLEHRTHSRTWLAPPVHTSGKMQSNCEFEWRDGILMRLTSTP